MPELDDPLADCTCCPRNCHAARSQGRLGYCRSGAGISVGSICVHRGEEPVIGGKNGICNVFFTRCNLQCVYCQNFQISRNTGDIVEHKLSLAEVVSRITRILDCAVTSVGFVSPSHVIPQMKSIIHGLSERKPNPTFIFNTNAYDKVETIRSLEGMTDVYLPDLKYMSADLAARFSDARNYPEVATAAIKEMFRQKGPDILLDAEGIVRSGLIIRHLVLPGQIENSRRCLRWIAEELSPSVHVSLLAQYRPTSLVANHPHLGRALRKDEYDAVLEEMEALGFERGWTQELSSSDSYRPDFAQSHPFEHLHGRDK